MEIKSRIVLDEGSNKLNLYDKFKELQYLIGIGIADHHAAILSGDGRLIPAGLYDDAYTVVSVRDSIDCIEDDTTMGLARDAVMKSIQDMEPIRKKFALLYWEKYYSGSPKAMGRLFDFDFLEELLRQQEQEQPRIGR